MAIEVAKYQFQSWARKGISGADQRAGHARQPGRSRCRRASALRCRSACPINAHAADAERRSRSSAPATSSASIATWSCAPSRGTGTRNFEPNYLAFIEFYDEDFPWRYTPAKPDGDNLRPWIFLLVLKEDEFERDDRRVPLPVVTVKQQRRAAAAGRDLAVRARPHSNRPLPRASSRTSSSISKSLQAAVTDRPGQNLQPPAVAAPSRAEHGAITLSSCRRSRSDAWPVWASHTAGVPAQKPAWDARRPASSCRSITTGSSAPARSRTSSRWWRLLEPRVLDARIGIRSMDCSQPGFVKVDGEGPRATRAAGRRDRDCPRRRRRCRAWKAR